MDEETAPLREEEVRDDVTEGREAIGSGQVLRRLADAERVIRYEFLTIDLAGAFGETLDAIEDMTSSAILETLRRETRWRRHGIPVFRWRVPYGRRSLDPRLFEVYRKGQALGPPIPLVLECGFPSEEVGDWAYDPFGPLDDLAWSVERLWEMEFDGVPPERRPGLVVARHDGALPLCTGLAPRLRSALGGLPVFEHVDAHGLKRAVRWIAADAPLSSADASRTLALLRSQGLLVRFRVAGERSRIRRGYPRRAPPRPLKRYSSVVRAAERILWSDKVEEAAGRPFVVTDVAPYGLEEPDRKYEDLVRWWNLVLRLRRRGLRSV